MKKFGAAQFVKEKQLKEENKSRDDKYFKFDKFLTKTEERLRRSQSNIYNKIDSREAKRKAQKDLRKTELHAG